MTSKTFKHVVSTTIAATALLCTARADITTGLEGYWSLSDGPGSSTVVDKSGNGNNGTLVNFTDATYNNMWSGNTDPSNGWPYALSFNESGLGTNTYVNIPDSTTLDKGTANKAWTIAAWVNCPEAGTSEPANAGIVAKGDLGTEQYGLFISGGQFVGVLRNSSNTGGYKEAASTTITANTWYHVAVTVAEPYTNANGAEIIVYVDGVKESAANNNTYTTVFSSTLPMTIGTRANGSGTINEPFSGTIDEVRFYDRALTPSDIMQLFDNRAFGIINNGVGWWNGSTGSGGDATLDTTSANFCTNAYTAPVGTFYNLANLLTYETNNQIPNSCVFGDDYYNNSTPVAVTSSNITIAPGGVSLANANGSGTLYFANSGITYTLASSDSTGLTDGGGSLTSLVMAGGGTTILTGVNTFTGGTTIRSGTLQIGNGGTSGSPLSSGSVFVNGTLAFDGDDNPTFNNAISGGGSVLQEGSGTLTLGNNNSYSGITTVSGGTLSVSSMADGTSSIGTSTVDLNNGSIIYTGTGDNTARAFNVIGTNTIDVPNGITLTLNGVVSGTSAVIINKVDTGTLVLGGTGNNADLGMNVNAGVVQLNKSGASIHAIGEILTINNGGEAQITGTANDEITNGVVVNSGGVFDLNGQSEAFNSLTLAGNGTGSGALINSSGSQGGLAVPSITLASAATIGGAGVILIDGSISGAGPLTYAGGSSAGMQFQSQNTYTGGTVINSGLLEATPALSLPGNVTVNGGSLQLDDPSAMYPTATLTLSSSLASGSVNLNFSGTENVASLVIGSTVMPGGVYGNGQINPGGVFTGGGVLNVGGDNWDANGSDATAAINSAGGGSGNWDSSTTNWWASGNANTIWAANDVAYFGGTAGTVTLAANETADGLIFATNNYTINNTDGVSTLSLAGEYPMIQVPTGTTTISADISSGGSQYGVVVTGPGTLVLSGTNTYTASGTTNGTLIENGATLSINSIADSGTSAIGTGGVAINNGGTLSFTGTSGQTARSVFMTGSTAGTINVPTGDSLEIDGQIHEVNATAAQNSIFTGGGTLTLGGSVDNSGLTMAITAGNVVITKSSTSTVHGLGGGTSIISSGASLQLAGPGGFDLYSGCILTVNSGGVLDVGGQNDSFSTLTLSGTGPVGATYPGALINSSGTTSLITNGGSGVVLAGATTIGGPGSITLASAISGNASLTYAGTGTLTLGAAGTYSGGTTISSGAVQLANQNAAGTGTIADNTTLYVNIAAGILTNPITGGTSSIVNIVETSGDNLTLNSPMSGFTGTINCPASASSAKAQIFSTAVNLPSTATINVANGGTLYLGNAVVIPCPVYLGGVGNTEVYGALRMESNAVVSGPVILQGSSTVGNNSSSNATISGCISDGGNGYSLTKTATAGPIILTSTNTFSGPITNLEGVLAISGSGCIGVTPTATNFTTNIANSGTFDYASSAAQILSGVVSGTGELQQTGPGTLTLTATNTFTGAISNGSTLVISGSGGLGVTATTTNYAGLITNNGTFNYASSAAQTLSGVIYGTGTLLQSGPGKLTLSGADVYTGPTTITSGNTLAIGSTGSINDTSAVNLPASGTLDASALSGGFSLGASTTVNASGSGTSVGSTAATIMAASGTGVTLGPVSLTYSPQNFTGDATHPALYISQGNLNITGATLAIDVAGSTPLGAGTYTLIQQASGSMNDSHTNFTLSGAGLVPGGTATLNLSGGSLNLVVTITSVPSPYINSVVNDGGGVLTLSGANGPANSSFYILTSTNLALPLSQWITNGSGSFTGTGSFSVSITNTNNVSPSYYSVSIPVP